MSERNYIDTRIERFGQHINHAARYGELTSAAPLVSFADDVFKISAGMSTLLNMVTASDARRDAYDNGNNVEPTLSPFDRENMLVMLATVSSMLNSEADRLADWCDTHIVKKQVA